MEATRAAWGETLIVGDGFAGSYVARLLGRAGWTIVSPESFMLYTTSLFFLRDIVELSNLGHPSRLE